VRAASDNPASNVGAQAAKPSPLEGGASATRAPDQGRIGDAPPPDAAPDLPADGRVEAGPARNAAALSAVVGGVGEATSLAAPAARDAVAGPRFELTPIAPQPLAPTDKAAAQAGAIVNQISIAVAGADRNKVEIRLDPPELGRVSVSLSLGDEGARAVIAVERQDVSDLLRRHGDMLQRDLAEAGFGDVSLEFADGGEAAQRGDEPEPEVGGRDDLATHEISQIAVARPADAGRRLDLRL
ncbi:MAG: flagellar hook-length control protein FliK, partial [Pseudomonadota bacterium]